MANLKQSFKQKVNASDNRLKDVIDTSTGEVMQDAFTAVLLKRKKNGFEKDTFFIMSQIKQLEIAKDSTLTLTEYRVMSLVNAVLDYQNFILMCQSGAAEELGMQQPQFARGLKGLINRGYIIKGPKVGTRPTLRLNPEYGWKGDGRIHQAELLKQRKTIEDRKKAANITHIITTPSTPIKTHVPTDAEILESQGQKRLID